MHLELGYAGCVVVQINGAPVDAANVESVYAAAVAGRGDDKVAVMLHRPREPVDCAGESRSANNRNSTYVWHAEPLAECVKLANNPEYDKRDKMVYDELKKLYEHKLGADHRMMLPPPSVVLGVCKREWGNRQKAKKANLQNAAANAVSRAIADANNEGDGEPDSDDESDDSDDELDSDHEGSGNAAKTMGVQARGGCAAVAAAAAATGDDGDIFDTLNEQELRARLKHLGVNTKVTNDDLGGQSRSRAIVEPILRSRLREAIDI